MSSLKSFKAAILVVLLPVFCHGTDITALYLTSEPGSWVGQGETVSIVPDGTFRIYAQGLSNPYYVRFQIDNFASVPPSDPSWRWWALDFAPPFAQQLQVGLYTNAWRPVTRPTESRDIPGLDVYGNTRGYNALLGEFEVFEISWSEDGKLQSFAADFEVFDGYGLQGAIRYHSTIPVPEPNIGLLSSAALLLIITMNRLRVRPNQSAAANRRPAGQSDGSGNLFATVAADRAFPAAVAELGR